MKSTITIIIPTYNAKEGVIATITGVRKAVPDATVTIVDDNSPDKTADLIKEHFKNDKKVKVLIRKQKGGRGSAILYGFKDALKNKDAKYFIEMDADLCHDPKYIKKLVAKCEKADVVIASRYIKGAKILGWSLKRKAMSRAINLLAKLLLHLPVTDYTDGYRCYSRRAVEFLSSQKFHATGYVVLSETAFLCYRRGFTFDELPIHINLQTVSRSNLNGKEIKEAISTIIRLRLSNFTNNSKPKDRFYSVCVICNSSDTTEMHKEDIDRNKIAFTYAFSPQANKTFRIVRCNTCTHVFCDPLPKNIYKNYEDVVDEHYLTQEDDRKATAKILLKEIRKYKKSGRLLDIGCATGDFLQIAKAEGYTVEGLELSKWSSRIAQKKGLKVYRSTLASFIKNNTEKYDIVTLWGVIEHFDQPLKEMQYINTILKPGGILIVWTGDVGSIVSRMLGRNWWYWMGQHIQYFTRNSIKLLGEKAGFEEVFSKLYPQAMTLHRVANSLDRYKYKKALLVPFQMVFALKPTWILKIPGELFWMAKKTSSQK